jgi:hypothetical protein
MSTRGIPDLSAGGGKAALSGVVGLGAAKRVIRAVPVESISISSSIDSSDHPSSLA